MDRVSDMKALVVSRLSLGERLIQKLKENGVKEFVDYFKHYKEYKGTDDVIKAVKELKCDTAVVTANFYTAVALLANGVNTVFVIVPKHAGLTEIISADLYVVHGNVTVLKYKV